MTGTIDNPATLQDALRSSRVRAGDTIVLLGGTYGPYTEPLEATTDGITLTNAAGQRAVVDGVIHATDITIQGSRYGLEFMCSDLVRVTENDWPDPAVLRSVVDAIGLNSGALINVIIHDTQMGVTNFDGGDTAIRGVIIYNNGVVSPDRAHGPGIYTHNSSYEATRTYSNLLILNSFRYGLQLVSAGDAEVYNYALSNIGVVNSSMVAHSASTPTPPGVDTLTMDGVCFFGGYPLLGDIYDFGIVNGSVQMTNCLGMGNDAFWLYRFATGEVSGCKFTNADGDYTLVDRDDGSVYTIEGNTWGVATGADYIFTANADDANFATVIVANWGGGVTASVDVSAWLAAGTVRIHNPMLMFSEYQDVTITEGAIMVPMTGWTTPAPIGMDDPIADAFPGTFGCWILEKLD